MKFLLDSDVVINHLRLRQRLTDETPPSESSISVITYGELLYGAHKSVRSKQTLEQVELFLREYSLPILPIDAGIATLYSQTKAELERIGERLDDMDLFIAATAIHYSLTLVTKNSKHFSRIPNLHLYA